MTDQNQIKSGLGMKFITMVQADSDDAGFYHLDIVEFGFGFGEKASTIGGMYDLVGTYLGTGAFMFRQSSRRDIFYRLRLCNFDEEQMSIIMEHLESQIGLSIYLKLTGEQG